MPSPSPLTPDERRALVEKNLEYARRLAAEIARRLPAEVALDDLVAYGQRGLLEAAQRFDPRRGAAFTTFAYYRIRGAIFDGLEAMAWMRGRAAADTRFESRANDLIRARQASDAVERAERPAGRSVERDLSDLAGSIDDLSVVFVATLEGFEPIGGVTAPDAPLPNASLRRALLRLPEREREILRLVYVEDLTIAEAGRRIKLSRAWASRIHARAIRQLREEIARR